MSKANELRNLNLTIDARMTKIDRLSRCKMKYLLLLILLLCLSACGPELSRGDFKATLDQMVLETVGVNPDLPTDTPTPSITPTSTQPIPTMTPLPTDTPIVSPTVSPTPTELIACLLRYNAANVRKYPDENSPRVAVISKNQCVTLLARTEDKEWAKVENGWITVRFFDLSGPIDRLPIEEE